MSVGRRALFAALAATASMSCQKTPAPPAGTQRGSPSASALADPGDAAHAAERPRLGDGCHAGVAFGTNPDQVLDGVMRACAPGMQPLGERQRLSLGSAQSEAKFSLADPAACVRFAAASDNGAADVTLIVSDASDQPLGEDALPGPIALVSRDGPICPGKSGELKARIGASKPSAIVVAAWRAQ